MFGRGVVASIAAICFTLLATSWAAADVDWTLTKTASPTTYSAAGDVIAYTYVISDTFGTGTLLSLTDNKVTNITCPGTKVPFNGTLTCTGTYTITAADVTAGSVTNTATAVGDKCTDGCDASDTATATVTYVATAGPPPPSTPPPYVDHRVIAILDDEPDRARLFRRFVKPKPPVVHAMYYDDPVDVNVSGSGPAGAVSVATSLQKVMSYAESDNGGVAGSAGLVPAGEGNPVDLWTEAHYKFGTGRQDFRFASWYLGADYLARPNLLLGVLSQVDWSKERELSISGTAEGTGWMVGPYATVHLAPNLYLDGRMAWGQSDNTILTSGGTDEFSTDRYLARVNLTGNWQRGDWRLTPSVALAYLSEAQHAYTDTSGASVAARTVSVGKMTAGPEIARRFVMDDGTVVEPMASVMFDWDFATSGQSSSCAGSRRIGHSGGDGDQTEWRQHAGDGDLRRHRYRRLPDLRPPVLAVSPAELACYRGWFWPGAQSWPSVTVLHLPKALKSHTSSFEAQNRPRWDLSGRLREPHA